MVAAVCSHISRCCFLFYTWALRQHILFLHAHLCHSLICFCNILVCTYGICSEKNLIEMHTLVRKGEKQAAPEQGQNGNKLNWKVGSTQLHQWSVLPFGMPVATKMLYQWSKSATPPVWKINKYWCKFGGEMSFKLFINHIIDVYYISPGNELL